MSKTRSTGPSQRQLRVGEEIRHALAAILARGHVRDPDLQGRSITVTEVRASPDLRNATAYVVPLGGGDMGRVVAALNRATPFLRHELGREVMLRRLPALRFEADASFDAAERIETVLRSPGVARDLEDESDDGA